MYIFHLNASRLGLATFSMLRSHVCLVATTPDCAGLEGAWWEGSVSLSVNWDDDSHVPFHRSQVPGGTPPPGLLRSLAFYISCRCFYGLRHHPSLLVSAMEERVLQWPQHWAYLQGAPPTPLADQGQGLVPITSREVPRPRVMKSPACKW